LGFAAMVASVLATDVEGLPVNVTRALLMAVAGVGFSLVLWRISAAKGRPGGRTAWLVLAVAGLTILHTVLDIHVDEVLRTVMGEGRLQRRIISDSVLRALVMAVVASSHVVVFATLHSVFAIAATMLRWTAETREREAQLAAARTEAVTAQLALLRHQLNPHFIFNTLNAIGSLVATGRNADAEEMIDRLSAFLRAALVADARPFTNLEDELATLQAYLEIEHARFGARLTLAWEVPADVRDAQAPSFLLQPLVENAIKHAVAPAMRPVQVRVAARRELDDLVIEVADTGAGAGADPRPRPGAGVGLQNVRERLALIYGARARLDTDAVGEGFVARVRLPLNLAPAAA
jgi:LytS/YehU family sensor histidine kinase